MYVTRLLQGLPRILKHWIGESDFYILQFHVIEVVVMNIHDRKESSCFLKRESIHYISYISLKKSSLMNFMKYTFVVVFFLNLLWGSFK